jgi:flagellar basal-body rod modification protein FlgD
MSVYDVAGLGSTTTTTQQKTGYASLGQADFLRLMTEQMKQQDPFAPVDNKEMLAQMAQFSQLAGVNDMNKTLTALGEKLDAILAAQKAALPAAASTVTTTTDTTTTTN